MDPLKLEPNVRLTMVRSGQPIPGDTDLVILPGTKSTRADLEAMRAEGWDIDLAAHIRRNGRVLGLCGGYQMLGRRITDPHGIEGTAGETLGLGHLDIETVMTPDKRLTRVTGIHASTHVALEGYEIHIGRSDGPDRTRPFAVIDSAPEGAISPNGQIMGTYLHGLFTADLFRQAFLAQLGTQSGPQSYASTVDTTLDALAAHLETHLNITGIFEMAQHLN